MYRPENLNQGTQSNPLGPHTASNIDATLNENKKCLAKAFESQCKEDFEEAFEYIFWNLQTVWNNLSSLIEHADKQPNTHSIIRDYREVLSKQMVENCFSRTDINLNSHTFSKNVVEGILNSTMMKNEKQKQKKNLWTEEEHQKFLEAIEKFGKKDFKKVAEYVKTRTVKQVRSHYQKHMMKINKQAAAAAGMKNGEGGEGKQSLKEEQSSAQKEGQMEKE